MPLPARFSQADIARALDAAKALGDDARVRITPDGEIIIEIAPSNAPAAPILPQSKVYLFENAGRVKIGYTRNAERRILHFALAIGREVSFTALSPGTWRDEQALHQHFKDQRVFGEWFEIVGPVADLMSSPQVNLESLLKKMREK